MDTFEGVSSPPPDRRPDSGVYAISVVAALTGIEPHTLRGYERAGLLTPSRSPGGTRLYSDDDLATARHVHTLAGEGINTTGIHCVLALEAENRELRAELVQLRNAAQRSASKR